MNQFMRQRVNGFTLIEVALVMVIIGFILAASITPLSNQIERGKIQETNLVLNDVMEALYGFAAANRRLPCPANATSNGTEVVNGANNCTLLNGFVPATTLGLTGQFNQDGLLLDTWHNPIRYAVTQADNNATNTGANTQFDFTFAAPGEMNTVTVANLNPDLVICTLESGIDANNNCTAGNTLANNAVAVILSLGKDGSEATAAIGITGGDQQENAGMANLPAGPSGISFQVADDTVFVSHEYKATTTIDPSGHGSFNDQIIWMSPFTLYDRMFNSNALP